MGPHKNGIVLNVEQFIKDVEARPAIWNRNYHCNKYFLEQTWQELCKIHKLPATVLKAKWKGLRDNFRVEFKRIPRNPDGQLAMAPEFHQSKWNHFFALQFLINHMRQRGVKYDNTAHNDEETVNCDDEECVVEPDIHNVLETCIDDNPEDLETQISNCKRRHQELVNEMNSMGNISMMNGHNLNLSVPIEKKSKLILDNNSCDETLDLTTNKSSRNGNNLNCDSISILNDFQTNQPHNSTNILDTSDSRNSNITINSTSTKNGGGGSGGVGGGGGGSGGAGGAGGAGGGGGCGVITNSTPFNNNCLDDDYHFLMSLHPYMQKLNRAKKLRVRTKIQKLIIRELYKRSELQN